MENILEQIKQDMLNLAEEHAAAAANEHMWALGTSYQHIAEMHEQNAEEHRELATLYRSMAENPLELLEQFGSWR